MYCLYCLQDLKYVSTNTVCMHVCMYAVHQLCHQDLNKFMHIFM